MIFLYECIWKSCISLVFMGGDLREANIYPFDFILLIIEDIFPLVRLVPTQHLHLPLLFSLVSISFLCSFEHPNCCFLCQFSQLFFPIVQAAKKTDFALPFGILLWTLVNQVESAHLLLLSCQSISKHGYISYKFTIVSASSSRPLFKLLSTKVVAV